MLKKTVISVMVIAKRVISTHSTFNCNDGTDINCNITIILMMIETI
jgi:hypothetical protein